MVDFLNKIFPENANNNYSGNRIALWALILFLTLMTWRSAIHMFFEPFGLHEIANIVVLTGDPDPMPLIYRFFSIWGFAQLIFCIACWIAIIKYRSFIPLMYLFWIFEWGVRVIYYPFFGRGGDVINDYNTAGTPGFYMAPYILILLLIFFVLSLRRAN